VYDALTTTRSYRTALTHEQALAEMHATRHFWRPDVFDAFLRAVERGPISGARVADDLFGDIPRAGET
jgi:HD-GYP domain-containing protein (c-di-GMP phosphodiesterase class II)